MALEFTGPPRPLEFSVRLPVLILAFGAGWAAARRRWGARRGGPSVPMATPALIISTMLGTAAVTARLASISPVLAGAVLLTAAVCLGMAAVLLIAGGRRRDGSRQAAAAAVRPREPGESLASRVPRQAVRPVGVDA